MEEPSSTSLECEFDLRAEQNAMLRRPSGEWRLVLPSPLSKMSQGFFSKIANY